MYRKTLTVSVHPKDHELLSLFNKEERGDLLSDGLHMSRLHGEKNRGPRSCLEDSRTGGSTLWGILWRSLLLLPFVLFGLLAGLYLIFQTLGS